MNPLDRAGSKAGKADGMERVAAGRELWIDDAVAIIRQLAVKHPYLCCDDVWAVGLTHPGEARALGPVFTIAAQQGHIESTPYHVKTIQKNRHRAPVRVWASRLYRGPVPVFHEGLLLSRRNP